jgi:hypothetical protein
MATPEALIKKMKTESLAKLKTMSDAARKKLATAFEKWFGWEWEVDSNDSKEDVVKTVASLHKFLWDTDQIASEGGLLDFLVENKILKETAEQRQNINAVTKEKAPAKKSTIKKPSSKNTDDVEILEGHDVSEQEALNIVNALNKKTGATTKIGDYAVWLTGEGSGSYKKFHSAVIKLLGQEATDAGEAYARLDNLLMYALKMGPDKIGGISMSNILKNNPMGKSTKTSSAKKEVPVKSQTPSKKPVAKAATKKPTPGAKSLTKTKEQLKAVNSSIAKLKNVKAVQTYMKLAKVQLRLKSKLS